MKMKNKKWLILIIIGISLISIALCLSLYNIYSDNQAGIKSQEALEELEETLLKPEQNNTETIAIDGNDYIGIIEIPALNLKLPVLDDCNDKNLKLSPCKYYGSLETNDLVICAHAYKSLFRYIKNLNQGDLVKYTDITGQEYLYEVKIIEILSPESIKEMIESEFDLTLYTCTNDNQNRVTVRLNKINIEK